MDVINNIEQPSVQNDIKGEKAIVNNVVGNANIVINGSVSKTFHDASDGLRNCNHTVADGVSIPRNETEELYRFVTSGSEQYKPERRVCVLVGNAGTGKTVVMRDLLQRLEEEQVPVLAIKSDQLFMNNYDGDINKSVGLGKSIIAQLELEAKEKRVVLLVDQIDALSSTLSRDRRPIDDVNNLVAEASKIMNVRIAISCRPYDLHYDASLDRYKSGYTVRIGNLPSSRVKEVLSSRAIDVEKMDAPLFDFLCNPLNLFLYCKLENPTVIRGRVTVYDLYNALWKEIVVDKSGKENSITRQSLAEYLTAVTAKMANDQVLAISKRLFETAYSNEQNFFLTNGFLVEGANSSQLQFLHQSMFDYIYARLFFESGKSLEAEFKDKHQGLFLRSRIKQIVDYQRVNDEDGYKKLIMEILTKEDANEKPLFRFHIKHLVMSSFGYYDYLSEFEKYLISDLVNSDDRYAAMFAESINSHDSFELLLNLKPDFAAQSLEWQKRIVSAAARIEWTDTDYIWQFYDRIVDGKYDSGLMAYIYNAINSISHPLNDPRIIHFIDSLDTDADRCHLYRLLNKLITVDVSIVEDYILKKTKDILAQLDPNSLRGFLFPMDGTILFNTLKEQRPDDAFRIIHEMLSLIVLHTIIETENCDIKCSYSLMSFNRENSHYDFVDEELVYLMQQIEHYVQNEPSKAEHWLQQLASSDLEHDYLLLLVGLKAGGEKYADLAFRTLRNTLLKTHSSSIIDYYRQKLFGAICGVVASEQLDELMAIIAQIAPEWEKHPLIAGENLPISRIGVTRTHYYSQVPEEYLKTRYSDAWSELNHFNRIFGNVTPTAPNKCEVLEGFSTMSDNAYEKMNDDDVLNSMRKYNKDFNADFSIPTLTGHARMLRAEASKNPQRYIDIYTCAVNDSTISKRYILEGLEGLSEGGADLSKITQILKVFISSLEEDVNNVARGVLIEVTRLSDIYLKRKETLPDFMFAFICKIVADYKDEEEHEESEIFDALTEGINQVRGCAAEKLVFCYYMKEYEKQIFDTQEKLEGNSSVATRAAAIFHMGMLASLNHDRMRALFLKLTSDHNVNLYNLQLHNQHPILFFLRYNFGELIPYFKGALPLPKTYENTVRVLWEAWRLTELPEANDLLYKFADASVEARASLVKYISFYYNHVFHDKMLEVYYRYMNYDEPELSKQYDFILNKTESWTRNELIEYLDRFSVSNACKHCNYFLLQLMKRKALELPKESLRWISNIYKMKKGVGDSDFFVKDVADVVIIAYNRIREFRIGLDYLEVGMDLFDELLADNQNRVYLLDCLDKLEE